MKLSFFVPGLAKPSGSKRAFMRPGMKHPAIVDTSGKAGKDWRGDVKAFAVAFINRHYDDFKPVALPVRVRFAFTFTRPKGHFTAKGNLKPSAPVCHVKRPDTLKLARAVEDALTGIVWRDDAQICAEVLTKEYGSTPGCEIVIETIETAEQQKAA